MALEDIRKALYYPHGWRPEVGIYIEQPYPTGLYPSHGGGFYHHDNPWHCYGSDAGRTSEDGILLSCFRSCFSAGRYFDDSTHEMMLPTLIRQAA